MTSLIERPIVARPGVGIAVGTTTLAACVAAGLGAARSPEVLLLAVVVAIPVAVALVRTDIAVLILVAAGPLEFVISYGAHSTLTVTKLAGALCFISFALNALVTRRRLVFDWTHGFVFAILAIALASTAHAQDFSAATSTTARYASFVALFFVVSQFGGDNRLFGRLAWVLSVSCCVAGGFALSNFFSGATSAARTPQGDPNDIAFVLVTTLPLTVWLLRERGVRRIVVLAMIGMISVSILLTLSRGALVGLAAALVWKLVVERRHASAIAAGVLIAALAVGVVVYLDPGRVETGLKAKAKVAQENVATRLDAWSKAADFAVDNPVVGIGPGNFRSAYAKVAAVPVGIHTIAVVHNTYLDIAAEIGLVAVILFLLYLGFVFARLNAAENSGRAPPGLANAVRTAVIIATFSGLTVSEQYFAPFWVLGGLAVAMWSNREPAKPA